MAAGSGVFPNPPDRTGAPVAGGETGESIADTAARHQVFFSPGDNKRLPGWMQLHYRLQFDGNGLPLMYVFRGCTAFIRTLPTLQYDPRSPEDLDTEGEDHAADEARYFLMSRPIRPRPDEGGGNPGVAALDIGQLSTGTPVRRMEILGQGKGKADS